MKTHRTFHVFQYNEIKTLLLILISILLLPEISNCQSKNDEISLSYGIYSSNSAHFEEIAKSVLLFGFNDKPQNIRETGPITISYKRVLNSKFGVGISIGTMHESYEYKAGSSWIDNSPTLKPIDRSVLTIAPELDFRYLRREKFNLYSTLGIGYSNFKYKGKASESSYSDGRFVFHLGLLGIRFGNKFGGFAELGFGYKGLINFGINYQI
jgi:hypothetical protein